MNESDWRNYKKWEVRLKLWAMGKKLDTERRGRDVEVRWRNEMTKVT